MIYVTSGHQKGIGLEIFLKSLLLISKESHKNFYLAVDENTFNENLTFLGLKQSYFSNLNVHFTKKNDFPESTKSLSWCLTHLKEKDILITLPTSKDQLIFNNQNQAGYTEFFRSYFKTKELPMVFKSNDQNVLLISDHVSLNNVSQYISNELIIAKTKIALNGFAKYFQTIDELVIAGLNPHAGEKGILGDEETKLQPALDRLKADTKLNIIGFVSGDTLHFHQKPNINQLFIYMFHDQGLAKFKAENGVIGLNITFGLPFLRLSVDHGTAFELYGKNKANISGMLYLLNTALKVNSHVN